MASYATDTLNEFGKPVSDFSSTIAPRRDALNAAQQGQESDYLTRYRQAIAGQEGLPHMYDRIGRELNMPNLRTSADTLNTTLANIPSTYSAATRGTETNANQLSRIISTKSAALAPTVTAANNAYQSAQDQQNKMIEAELTQQEKQLQPYATEQQFLSDRWAREQTGFTTDNQAELDSLIAKMNSGVTLSEGERQRANQLSIAEKQYQTQLKIAEMNNASSEKIAAGNQDVNRQANLIALAGNY